MRVAAILVPFRDEPAQNRAAHLHHLLLALPPVLDAAAGSEWGWRILVGVQGHDGRKFSRGRVLNALFLLAQRSLGADLHRVVLHDVDLVPSLDRARGYFLPMPPRARVLALNATGEYVGGLGVYIGGICALDPHTFEGVDGFPNAFEGWGGEDDALRDRVGGPAAVSVYVPGDVRNLEEDPEFARPEHVRARQTPRFKMPKEDRLAVRRLGAGAPGLRDLRFCARRRAEAAPCVAVCDLDVSLLVPAGWEMHWSRGSGLPYYVCPASRVCAWRPPTPYPSSASPQ